MVNFRIPGAQGWRTVLRDLREGHAGWIVRLGLSFVSATLILAVAMLCMSLMEMTGGWLRDEQVGVTLGVAAAILCGTLAFLWWTFHRFQVVLKSVFAVLATWAIVIPTAVVIESLLHGNGEDYMIASVILMGIAVSIGSVIMICYSRYRAGPGSQAIVHVKIACPECGYSLLGLTDCRCPECGTTFTVETLVEMLGRGQLVARDTINAEPSGDPSRPAETLDSGTTPPALPEPGSA